jgi:hypothetical protein
MSNKTHRLFTLALSALVTLILASCGAATPATTQPSTAASASATAASAAAASDAGAASAAASASSAASPDAPVAIPSVAATPEETTAAAEETATALETATAETVAGQDATPAIVAAANAFLATLSDSQRESALFDWTDTEQKQRWSNLPEGLYERAGLKWGDLSEQQQTAWLAVMQATLSEEGYNRVIAEWNADDALAAAQGSGGSGGGPGGQLLFGKQYYYIALIGTPSEAEPWQWQWGGHHVTVNATIAGSDVALTPSFIGCQPCEYTDATGATVRPLGDINDEAFALVNALDAVQQQAAVLGSSSIDLVLGPGQDDKTIQAEGLPASQMTADQQGALLQLISHYTGLINDEDAAARIAEIESTLDQTYFAWYGATAKGSASYFRITGPTIVIEYSPQGGGGSGVGLGGAATLEHIHGIYRDPTNDYGAKYTQ